MPKVQKLDIESVGNATINSLLHIGACESRSRLCSICEEVTVDEQVRLRK